MEGGVPPLAEVQPGQHAGLAGHPGVDLVVWQYHRVHLTMIMLGNRSTLLAAYLNVLDLVGVVAEDAGQLHPPDLVQLLQGEGARPAAVLVPEPAVQTSSNLGRMSNNIFSLKVFRTQ